MLNPLFCRHFIVLESGDFPMFHDTSAALSISHCHRWHKMFWLTPTCHIQFNQFGVGRMLVNLYITTKLLKTYMHSWCWWLESGSCCRRVGINLIVAWVFWSLSPHHWGHMGLQETQTDGWDLTLHNAHIANCCGYVALHHSQTTASDAATKSCAKATAAARALSDSPAGNYSAVNANVKCI